jgi:hypothetical protein
VDLMLSAENMEFVRHASGRVPLIGGVGSVSHLIGDNRSGQPPVAASAAAACP